MGRRLIVDADVLITWERTRARPAALLGDDDLAIPGIVAAELWHGVFATDQESQRGPRQAFVDWIAHGGAFSVLAFTAATAREHGFLLDAVRRRGEPRGAHDLIIAAHARETDRLLLTQDAQARFDDLPGVRTLDPGTV